MSNTMIVRASSQKAELNPTLINHWDACQWNDDNGKDKKVDLIVTDLTNG
jgi:hypothetical protein